MGNTKLATHEETGLILQRYDPTLAHHLVYTYDELRAFGIQPGFLMALLEVFEDRAAFKPAKFEDFSLAEIVGYIQKTHTYYINKKLPEIEQSIHLLGKAYSSTHPLLLLLHTFYTAYTRHLTKHIEMEERDLLPYIIELEKASKNKNERIDGHAISISSFIDHHHDTEKDLEEVRTAILHYTPPVDQQTRYRILLSQLQVLENDLAVHALIEDEVLLPRALALEKSRDLLR